MARSQSDTLIAEVLPLLDAIRFLERNAQRLLSPRKLGARHRPFWLTGIQSELHHDPIGHILVIGPANFPLFLPGVQTAQALAAGNSVTWKPGAGGEKVARLFAHVLREAGLPRGILHVTDDTVEAAQTALHPRDPAHRPDKVVFTGSATTGRKLLHTLADTLTPATLELSGVDAVIVLPSADLPLAAKAVAFGLRLNGAEVCMSPRRLVAIPETLNKLRPLLQAELAKLPPVSLRAQTAETLQILLTEAQSQGAQILPLSIPIDLSPRPERREVERLASLPGAPSPSGIWEGAPPTPAAFANDPGWPFPSNAKGRVPATEAPGNQQTRPLLLDHANATMAITRTDLFAPILSLIEAPTILHIPDLANNNPYALTAAIFGNPREAQTLATQLRVGTVLINDLIAPTADPRTPFGGRGQSGFGLTRGAEGLLEMTASKTILRRAKGTSLHYDPLRDHDLPLFAGLIGTLHAGSLRHRWHALRNLITAARTRTKP